MWTPPAERAGIPDGEEHKSEWEQRVTDLQGPTAHQVIFTVEYKGGSPEELKLGCDMGLNATLVDALAAEFARVTPFTASVFLSHDVTVRSGWGHVCSSGKIPDSRLMSALGWSPSHLASVLQDAATKPAPDTVQLTKPAINLLWPGIITYGHWLLDTVARLELLCQARPDASSFVALIPQNPAPYMLDILEAFGITEYFEVGWSREVRCPELFSPGHTRAACSFPRELYKAAYSKLRKYMHDRYSVDSHGTYGNSLLVGHTPLSSATNDPRTIENIDEIASHVLLGGYKTMDPLEFTLGQQFNIFSKAKNIMGIDSSAMHNALFAEDGQLEGIIVFCVPWRFNYNHYLVADLTGARLSLIPGRQAEHPGSCRIELEQLRAAGL